MSDGDQTVAAARHPAFPAPDECERIRAGQDGKQREPLRALIRYLPSKAGSPVMTDKVEPPIAVANGGYDAERVADQMIDAVASMVCWIG